jgi:hypothetical protein
MPNSSVAIAKLAVYFSLLVFLCLCCTIGNIFVVFLWCRDLKIQKDNMSKWVNLALIKIKIYTIF